MAEVDSTSADRLLWKRSEENSDNGDDIWDDSALIEAYDRAVRQVKDAIAKRNKEKNSVDGQSSGSDGRYRRQGRSKKKNKPKQKWKVGDFCQARYSRDGLLYEACIKSVAENDGTCLISYIGYDNEEEVPLGTLHPSTGKRAREEQGRHAHHHATEAYGYGEKNGWAAAVTDQQGKMLEPNNACRVQRQGEQVASCSQDFIPGGRSNNTAFFSSPIPPCFSPSVGHTLPRLPTFPPPPPFPMEEGLVTDEEALASMLMSWYMSGYHTGYYQGLRQGRLHDTIHRNGRGVQKHV